MQVRSSRAQMRKVSSLFLSTALVVSLSPIAAFAGPMQGHDDSATWSRLLSAQSVQTAQGRGSGALAPQTPIKSIHDQNYDGLQAQASIPSSYSSVEKGRVSSVTNQGSLGTCWAFSTIAAAESSILSKGLASSADLSERHLAYFTYHPQTDPLGGTAGDAAKGLDASFSWEFEGTDDLYLAAGGNGEMTMHALSSWSGVANESAARYGELLDAYSEAQKEVGPGGNRVSAMNKFLSDTALASSLAYSDSYHMQNGYMIALADRAEVKQAIMNHGAVAVNINSDEAPLYFNEKNGTLYNPDATEFNHMVAIVGWDDGFGADRFGLQVGWDEKALSAPMLTDEGMDVTLDAQGDAWLRYQPVASGFYSMRVTVDGTMQYGVSTVVFKLDDKSGKPLWMNKTLDGEVGTDCYLEQGVTYYFKMTRTYGDRTEFSFNVAGTPGTVAVPADATQIVAGQKVALGSTVPQWLSFTPEKTGTYKASTAIDGTGYSSAYLFCENPAGNDKLVSRYVVASSGYDITGFQLRAGQTYYFQCLFSQSASASFSVDLEKEEASVSGDPRLAPVDPSDASRPSKNGAWLCKNSWGTDWGNDGFFWLSYEDAILNAEGACVYAYEMASAKNYDNNYQYDGSPAPYYNVLPSGGSIANVFTAKANPKGGEELKAISLSLYDVNVDYSIQVYVNPTDAAKPTSGSPVLAQPATGRLGFSGVHTIDLPKSVPLSEGTKFAVVATLSHADGTDVNYAVDTTAENGFVAFTNACAKGQSLSLYPNASSWYDLSGAAQRGEDESRATARIKALTVNTAAAQTTVSIAGADVKVTGVADVAGEKKPTVSVSYAGVPLVEGKQYSLASKYDPTSGLITITVTGLGAYSGTKTLAHQSTPAPKPADPTTKPDAKPEQKPDVKPEQKPEQKPGDASQQPGAEQRPSDPGAPDSNPPAQAEPARTQVMYRLYNPNSGEHFYTASEAERDSVVAAGWNDEGVGWTAPTSGIQVYRLYNAVGGEHHYTVNAEERDVLVAAGWIWEDGGWFSDPGESVPLFRAYNPNAFANNHNYTVDANEHQTLLSWGWLDEGVGWHGVK